MHVLLASAVLDTIWKVSAGLIAPILLFAWRRLRKTVTSVKTTLDDAHVLITETVPEMAKSIVRLEADVNAATATMQEHTNAITQLSHTVTTSGGMTEVIQGVIAPLMTRMAEAQELRAALNAGRSPSRSTDPADADFTDRRADPL